MPQYALTLAGVGGQGSILAGVILGTAAVAHDRKYAVQTQAYSAELRGGFAAAWVIVSDRPVLFPRVIRPDILVAQAQDAVDRFAGGIKPGGMMIFDSDLIQKRPDGVPDAYGVPATSLARNRIQDMIVTNMIMLGALCRVTAVVGRTALEKAIAEAVPESKQDMNLNAFKLGFESVKKI